MKNSALRFERFWAPVWVLVALVLRLVYVSTLPDHVLYSDERDHYQLAVSLAQGQGYELEADRPTAVRPPGYPLFLALCYRLGLHSLPALRMVQAGVGAATVWLLYVLISTVFSNRRWALATLAMGAVYPYFIYLPGAMLATTWFSFLLILSVFCLCRSQKENSPYALAMAGVSAGLAVLTVPTMLVLVLMTVLWFLRRRMPWRSIMSYIIAVAVVLAPWLYRNATTLGLINICSTGGYNFWLGNNPNSQIDLPCSLEPPPALREKLHSAVSEHQVDRIYLFEALGYIAQDPAAFAGRTLNKALFFWRLDPSPVTKAYIRQGALITWVGSLSFAGLLVLAILGALSLPASARPLRALWVLYSLAFTFVYALTIVKVRFRLPLDHLIVAFSAYGFSRVWQWLCEQRFVRRCMGCEGKSFFKLETDADWSQGLIEREKLV
ncbi:MAG TPA: glycosyltransferase family 39 protein [bacterium]|nr:glycosyltransferase family 39 protein [bacterium]